MEDPREARDDEEPKLSLHDLTQFHVELTEKEKKRLERLNCAEEENRQVAEKIQICCKY